MYSEAEFDSKIKHLSKQYRNVTVRIWNCLMDWKLNKGKNVKVEMVIASLHNIQSHWLAGKYHHNCQVKSNRINFYSYLYQWWIILSYPAIQLLVELWWWVSCLTCRCSWFHSLNDHVIIVCPSDTANLRWQALTILLNQQDWCNTHLHDIVLVHQQLL